MQAVSNTFQAVRIAGAAGGRPRRVAPFAAASANKNTARRALSSRAFRAAAAAAAGPLHGVTGFNIARYAPPLRHLSSHGPVPPRGQLGFLS